MGSFGSFMVHICKIIIYSTTCLMQHLCKLCDYVIRLSFSFPLNCYLLSTPTFFMAPFKKRGHIAIVTKLGTVVATREWILSIDFKVKVILLVSLQEMFCSLLTHICLIGLSQRLNDSSFKVTQSQVKAKLLELFDVCMIYNLANQFEMTIYTEIDKVKSDSRSNYRNADPNLKNHSLFCIQTKQIRLSLACM